MHNDHTAEQDIQQDVREQELNSAAGWSAQELARIFAPDTDDEVTGHAQRTSPGPVGPNHVLGGGPYPNRDTAA